MKWRKKMPEYMYKYFNSEGKWVRKPTIRWLASFIRTPHFFSKGTLTFFNQTLSDFRIVMCGGRLFIYAADRNALGRGQTLYTTREVTTDGSLHSFGHTHPFTFEADVLAWIEENVNE
jgi:hypothetical protein